MYTKNVYNYKGDHDNDWKVDLSLTSFINKCILRMCTTIKGIKTMTKWFDDVIAEKIHSANNHVILIPAQNPNAPLDTVDVYDGITGKVLVTDVPESSAQDFAIIWNSFIDDSENNETAKKINLAWLTDSVGNRKRY